MGGYMFCNVYDYTLSLSLPHIPNDLVFEEILFRLPVKSLGRFKLVSKSWNSFISSAKFHKLHLQRGHAFTSSTVIFMQAHYRKISGETSKYFEFFTFKILPNNTHDDDNDVENIEFDKVLVSQKSVDAEDGEIEDKADYEVKSSNLIGTCNGLICFQLERSNRFCIWNPITRKRLRFNGPPGSKGRIYRSGFGYDSSSHQIKILLMYGKAMAYLFTSKDRVWKRLDTSKVERDLRAHRCLSLHSHGQYLEVLPILVGETLYWLVDKYSGQQIRILTFDLNTNNLKFTPLSRPIFTDEPHRMFLCEIGQSLCVCLCGRTRLANDKVQVWKLEQNGKDDPYLKFLYAIKNAERYTNRYDNMFELTDQSGRLWIPNLSKLWDPIVLHPNNEHPHRREYDRIVEQKPIGFNWYCGFRYTESLISPHEFFMYPLKAKVKRCSKVKR